MKAMSARAATKARSASRATRAREGRPPDLTPILELMTEDIQSSRAKPVRRRFVQLVAALERTKARYAICGAVAMGAHGAERYTRDIDVLVEASDLDRVIAALAPALVEIGREPDTGPAKQVRLRSKRAKGPRAVDIDLMVPVDAVEAWALATSVRARAFDRKADIASVEALVVMKLRAYLSDPEYPGSARHRADAFTLLTTTAVDLPALRRFVKATPDLAAELERLLAAPPPRGRVG
jgi:hypothetical protein